MKKLKWLVTSIIATLLLVAGAQTVHAASMNFSVTPVLPSNQVNPNEGYFDLLLDPGKTQTLEVQLTNSTDKKVTVETSIASATTNINGLVEYSPNAIKPDSSLKYNLKDQVKAPSETVLEPKSQATVKLEVNMPKDAFNGVVAGGVTFKQKASETAQSNKSQGVTINNEYQYVVALLMRQQKGTVPPTLALNSVAPSQVNARNVINANLQNAAMGYLNQMNTTATVTGISDKSLKYNYNNSNMQMAPNTNFDLPIPVSNTGAIEEGTNSQPLKPGKYHLHMVVYGQKDTNGKYETAVDGKNVKYAYRWVFDKDFEVTGEQARTLNAKDVTVKHDKFNWWWLIIAAIFLILLLILFFILWKRRKKDEEEDPEKAALEAKLAEAEAKLKANENADGSADEK